MIFRLKTNPQRFFCSNINFCKRLQTWITSITPFENVYQDTSLRQIFIFQFSFFPHASTKILITYFRSIALSCNPFMIQANSDTSALHHHFSKPTLTSRSVCPSGPVLFHYPHTQLQIFSFLFLHASHQAILFDAYW